ncbi:sorbitol dehydrogenase [Annulohypoxylon moriforme]|nr:sorbitol dehydrogenase [Annulohypoxylon moriforme]
MTATNSCQVKAQVLYGPKDLRLISRELGPPGIGEVQVEVKATTLCGSDIHYYTYYRNGDIQVREPLSPGHEAAGIILAVGLGVVGLEVGDKVALEVGVPCDECEDCRAGTYNICEKLRFRSSATKFPHYQGTLQERLNHPSKWVHKLPAEMDLAYGALLEPLAVGIQAVNKAEAKPGNNCLIIGAGAVGLLCAAAAKASGYGNIVMADVAQNRLDFALENKFADAIQLLEIRQATSTEHGLELAKEDAATLMARNRGGMFHRVFECTGVESCVRTSIYATRAGGKILLVGMGVPIQTLPLSAAALREVSLIGVWRYANCYPRGLQIMSALDQGASIPDVRKLITHRYKGLESASEAFGMAARTKDDDGALIIKVVIEA